MLFGDVELRDRPHVSGGIQHPGDSGQQFRMVGRLRITVLPLWDIKGTAQMAQKQMLRAEVGMRVRCAKKQVRNDSGGRGALAKFLGNIAKGEEFVGVAHSAEQ